MATTIEKVSCFPNEGTPQVIPGDPQAGDIVRITTSHGCEIYERYTPPAAPPGPQPTVLSWGALASYLIGLLGGGATGRAALGAIIKACQGSAQGADNFFAVYFTGQTTFTKAEFTGVLADVATGVVTNGQKTAVANNWPTT